jgi:hypothetical protein
MNMGVWLIASFIDINKQDGKETTYGYRLATFDNSPDSVRDYTKEQLIAQLSMGALEIVNAELQNGEVVTTKGSIDRYTKICGNVPYGKCSVIILKEFPDSTYAVGNHMGAVERMPLDALINYQGGIANASVVENSNHTKYIRSLGGEFEKDRMFNDLANGDRAKAKLRIGGITDLTMDDNTKLISGKNTTRESIIIPVGCLGVESAGFSRNLKIKHVELSKTCLTIGASAFEGCENLETIIIPEGVTTIPVKCFAKCKSLKSVKLPNSLKKIDRQAFDACKALKEVSIGPAKPIIAPGSLPGTAKIVIRR